jgi:Protein of unknown function (DUF2384)
MKITNTDGHDVATVEDHFALTAAAFETVFEKLAGLDGVNVDECDRKGARLTFTRPGNALHAGWKNTIVGSARLTPTRLVVSTNSIERAEAMADRMRDVLGNLATWKKRMREELPVRLGGASIAIDGQALDSISPSAVDAFRAWLDSPLPMLGGHTPRQAARDTDGRHGVHLLLKEMENRHARKPIDGCDPVQLRRELRGCYRDLPIVRVIGRPYSLQTSLGQGFVLIKEERSTRANTGRAASPTRRIA